jgi:cytochrome P450
VTDLPPGPRLPGALQTLRYTFDQPRFFAQNRARFGGTWTLRLPGMPPGVVTTDRDAIKRLFTGDPLTKRHGNDILRPFFGDRSLLLLEPAEHLARRRLELPSFHGKAIAAYERRIRELATDDVATWQGTVDTHEHARTLTLAVILELVLGVRDRGLGERLAASFDALNTPAQNLAQFMPQWLIKRSRWNPPAEVAYRRLDRVRDLLEEHVARTRERPGDDVLSLLAVATDEDGDSLSDEDLRDELLTLVAAGHETTATAIAWGCDLLAHNPQVAQRLHDSLVAGDREYLKATAKEILRARTVAYISGARYPLEPFPIRDWVLEPGVAVLVDAQGVHGDPEVHPEPDQFRPERFLGDQGGRVSDYGYVPFGGGAHRCLGASLAMLELELALEAIVMGVELSPAGPPAVAKRRGVILEPDNGGRVVVRPRRRLAAPSAAA